MKILASRLRNRVELWRREIVEEDIGNVRRPVFLKKIWVDIIPVNSSEKEGQANTEKAEIKSKMLMRETEIKKSDYIIHKGIKHEVLYINPSYDGKGYIEVYTRMVME